MTTVTATRGAVCGECGDVPEGTRMHRDPVEGHTLCCECQCGEVCQEPWGEGQEERLRAVLEASTDADEGTLRGIFSRGDLSRADYRAAMEDAAAAAGGGLCEMCAHGGVVTVTRNKRAVRQGFLGTLWRGGEHACEECGGATVSLHVCLECEANGVRHEPDYYCPGCWRALED